MAKSFELVEKKSFDPGKLTLKTAGVQLFFYLKILENDDYLSFTAACYHLWRLGGMSLYLNKNQPGLFNFVVKLFGFYFEPVLGVLFGVSG